MEVVSVLRTALAGKVGRERFELWFGGSTRLTLSDGALIVTRPTVSSGMDPAEFPAAHRSRLHRDLGQCPALQFHIDPTLAPSRNEAVAPDATPLCPCGAALRDIRPFDGPARCRPPWKPQRRDWNRGQRPWHTARS